jgi:myo-inositol-1(or 4)-monophosphatase
MELDRVAAVAEDAARGAGALLRAKLGTHLTIRSKGLRSNLVTEADTESEALIRSAIALSFPDDRVLGEEEGDSGQRSRGRWIVDPLDGTTNYAHGYHLFSVSIAYEYDGELCVGIVFNPISGEMFRATKGGGAFCNGDPIHVSAEADLKDSLLVTGFPPLRPNEVSPNLAMFAEFMRRCQAIRRDGSAALDLCFVAAGRFDGFWEADLAPWDVAAGTLILKEACGVASDYQGQPTKLDARQIIASNGKIHAAMIEVLSKRA